ncbi:MAG: DNA methyltransferase [Caldilineaceae bacterium]
MNLVQPLLPIDGITAVETNENGMAQANGQNVIEDQDRPVHDWYRFVLSYPPHLVREYIQDFGLTNASTILDPFCGTETTVVEAKLCGIHSVGIEANPFPHFASTVKTDWSIDPDELLAIADEIAQITYKELSAQGLDDRAAVGEANAPLRTLSPETQRILIKDSISPIPLHKTLLLLENINDQNKSSVHKYYLLGLGNALVNSIGNLRFGPEVGVGKLKADVPVVALWMHEIRKMARDLRTVQRKPDAKAIIHLGDARQLASILPPCSIDAVITSPPYPNEKDYTRTTRLESVLLGFFAGMPELREHKQMLLRSNTRGVYKIDNDDLWVEDNPRIQHLADMIEARRVELGKTSGFEKLYGRVTKLYFGGMVRHLSELRQVLRPGAKLAYVVGDQASYLRVMIRTGEILAELAQELGYELERIDLFRTRFATATQCDLREEVVVLKWPGK